MRRHLEADMSPVISELLESLSRPWTMHILWVLSKEGPTRFGVLRKKVGKVSPRMLTERLRGLEGKGVVYRHYKQTMPPEVTYGLTTRFEEIGTVFKQLDRLVRRWQA